MLFWAGSGFGTSTFNLIFWVFVIILLVIGGRIYVKLRPHFADTV